MNGEFMNEELVSVIIPIYNVQNYLNRCIDSILNNTYQNVEVICVDDGSTDDSLALIRDIAEKDHRVKVFSQSNQGVSAARNLGIEKASGNYLTFIDADDFVHKRYIEIMMKCIMETNGNLVSCKYVEFEDEKAISELPIETKLSEIYEKRELKSFLYDRQGRTKCWGKIYKKSILSNQRFPEGIKLGEDSIFVLRYLSNKPERIWQCNDVLYFYYHGRSDSAIHSQAESIVLDCIDIYIEDSKTAPEQIRHCYLINGLKEVLIVRYSESLHENRKDVKIKCKNMGKELLGLLRHSNASVKEKIAFHVFYKFPAVYHAYRLIIDPTLWKYERKLKLEHKQQRNAS